MNGVRHLVECRCILSQFKNNLKPIFHKFLVFSTIDDDDTVISKFVQCNNCGIIHKIIDICKSEIMNGREESRAISTIEDIKLSLPEKLTNILEKYELSLPTWEQAKFILDNNRWGDVIVLSTDILDNQKQIKYLKIISNNLFSIENYTTDDSFAHNT